MEDLIARAKKYAKGAGLIQEGQRMAAERNERLARWLGWVSTALSAIVGTSIFASWAKGDCSYVFGFLAIVAATLSAMQRTSKLDARANDHRVAGAEYGGFRRRADMLRLRLEGGDVTRANGLAELEQIGKELSGLAKKTRTLPRSIYELAETSFKKSHPEYFAAGPSHAGGVVIRREATAIHYLIVRSKQTSHEWVLPKGRVVPGESPEQAARREVLTQTGVETAVRDILDTVEFSAPNERGKVLFFLMEAVPGGSPPCEEQERKWLNFDDAMQALRFHEAKRLLLQAETLLRHTTGSSAPQ